MVTTPQDDRRSIAPPNRPGSRRPWTIATATALGGSHQRSGRPNQDAIATFETDDGLCIAVADGHGGERYVRSADGSRLAVEVACRAGAEALRANGPLLEHISRLPRSIVSSWRAEVVAHLMAHPLDPELHPLVANDPAIAYGSTLLIVLFRRDEVVALQLGDGDIIAAWSDGTVARPVPDDVRNVAGQTTSLCLPDAATSFRAASLTRGGRSPDLVLAATDGYGNSFADHRWADSVASDMLQMQRSVGIDGVADALPRWASDSADVGGDDTSIAVAFLDRDLANASQASSNRVVTPPVTTRPASAATRSVEPVRSAGPRRDSQPGRRRSVLPLAAAGILAVGLGAGFVAGRAGATPTPTSVNIDDAATVETDGPDGTDGTDEDRDTPSRAPSVTVTPNTVPTVTPPGTSPNGEPTPVTSVPAGAPAARVLVLNGAAMIDVAVADDGGCRVTAVATGATAVSTFASVGDGAGWILDDDVATLLELDDAASGTPRTTTIVPANGAIAIGATSRHLVLIGSGDPVTGGARIDLFDRATGTTRLGACAIDAATEVAVAPGNRPGTDPSTNPSTDPSTNPTPDPDERTTPIAPAVPDLRGTPDAPETPDTPDEPSGP